MRRDERVEKEGACFNSDHYLCDLYESDNVMACLNFQTPWGKLLTKSTASDSDGNWDKFSRDEQETLVSLPAKRQLLDKETVTSVYLGLADIL